MKLHHLLLCIFTFNVTTLFGQITEVTSDTLPGTVEGIQQTLEVRNRLKISGYIQAQFQIADSSGQQSFNGGNFAAGVDKRFAIRRGRIKFQYDAPLNEKLISTSQYVLQFDVTERGLNIKDAYAKFTDQWTGWFSVTAGMQNRPFGYEIVYSSGMRETPERGRMSQIIFRNERDLGAMLTIQGPKTSSWNWLKIDAGLFNGTGAPSLATVSGINGVQEVSDFDKKKDFIGHIGIIRTSVSEKVKYSGGVSYYDGGYRLDNDTIYSVASDAEGVTGYIITSSSGNKGKFYAKRKHIGADAQLSIDWKAGITTIRGEYIQGDQPNTYTTTVSPFTVVTAPIYNRSFNGAYFYFLQNIAQTPWQVVVKYDWYDPNTEVKGDDIGKAVTAGMKATNATDIRYDTWGFGLVYRWDANIKITAYYDNVMNEKTSNLSVYNNDLKDNVFTLRAQVKF
jgi:hypothetical protein